MIFKPMLAGKLESLDAVRWPVLATPKVDGIRCLITEVGPVSRKLKLIPNEHVRWALSALPVGLDGELWVPGAKCFGDVSAAIMKRDWKPEFQYLVFDSFSAAEMGPGYEHRAAAVEQTCRRLDLPWLQALEQTVCHDAEALLRYEEACLDVGFEGVMLRDPNGPYKHGRSTTREGYLLKWKRFEDAEAVVIGAEEFLHNGNELERDALGHAKRSTHKDGKRPGGKLGALLCRRDDGVEFSVGSGFDDEQRERLWVEHAEGQLVGTIVKYRHQPHGAKEKPRIPVFIGFRHADDMGEAECAS